MKYGAVRLAVLSVIFAATPSNAATWTATPDTIAAVFKAVGDGDTIVMSGSFGLVKFQNRSFAKGITIDATAATFSDSLVINKIDGLSITGGNYGSPTVPTTYLRAIAVTGGSNISIANVTVTGPWAGSGIGFSGTVNASVTNGVFTRLKAGVYMDGVVGGLIAQNVSQAAASDGFQISGSRNVLVTGNSCSGTTPLVGYHPDCVQMWTSPTSTPQSDITISNNSAVGATQGFTGFDSSGVGYDRITITNNSVAGYYPQGIACYNCRNSLISGNVTSTLAGAPWIVNINVVGGSNNIVTGNTIGSVNKSLAVPFTYYSVQQTASGPTLVVAGSAASFADPSAVPEPGCWTMLVAGFGLVGSAFRRRTTAVAR